MPEALDVIWDTLQAFRGRHDFNVEPILRLPNGDGAVEVWCSRQIWEGNDMTFIQGRIAGFPQTAIVLAMYPYQDLGD